MDLSTATQGYDKRREETNAIRDRRRALSEWNKTNREGTFDQNADLSRELKGTWEQGANLRRELEGTIGDKWGMEGMREAGANARADTAASSALDTTMAREHGANWRLMNEDQYGPGKWLPTQYDEMGRPVGYSRFGGRGWEEPGGGADAQRHTGMVSSYAQGLKNLKPGDEAYQYLHHTVGTLDAPSKKAFEEALGGHPELVKGLLDWQKKNTPTSKGGATGGGGPVAKVAPWNDPSTYAREFALSPEDYLTSGIAPHRADEPLSRNTIYLGP